MLKINYSKNLIEAGCDEAGRGCLAGPVFAAAVILPRDYYHKLLNDSKQINEKNRYLLRKDIEDKALAWEVASVDQVEIDEINILNASILAMHRALDKLKIHPDLLLIDGNRFKPYLNTPHHCIIKGDSEFASIAAASILAKTYRDDYMVKIAKEFPEYNWEQNKGYPTKSHRETITRLGICCYHRKSFKTSEQLKLGF